MTDDFKIEGKPSSGWMIYNGSRQLNDIPATCTLGEKDTSFEECANRLSEEGISLKDYRIGDSVLYGDGITVIKAGKQYVALEILSCNNQLTDISISSDRDGDIKAIRLGGEFNCLLENDDVKYTDWVRISCGGNFMRMIEDFALHKKELTGCNKANTIKPTVYKLGENLSYEALTERLTFLRGVSAPFDYVEVGPGWQSMVGDWEPSPEINLSQISSTIAASGYKPGIWTSPFIADKHSDVLFSEKKWALRHADGSLCTYTFEGKEYAVMDISSEEYLEWLEMTYQRLSAYGFYLHNIDHTNAFMIQKDVIMQNPTLTITEAYLRAMKTIKSAIGNDGCMYVTNGFNPPLCGIADIVQISSSVDKMKSKNYSNVIPKIINQVAMRGYMSQWWHNACSDVLNSKFSAEYSAGEMKNLLVCEYMSGGTTMVTDLKNNDNLKLMKLVYPVAQLKTSARAAYDENAYISVVDVEVNNDYHTLCFFNNSFADVELIFRLDNGTCGGYVDHMSTYNVSSYFSREIHRDCKYDNILKMGVIPANSCEVVKIAKSNKPQVIMSDMHLSLGGEVEVKLDNKTVKITGNNPFNCKGNYVIALPDGEITTDGKREFSFSVNGSGPFSYNKNIR